MPADDASSYARLQRKHEMLQRETSQLRGALAELLAKSEKLEQAFKTDVVKDAAQQLSPQTGQTAPVRPRSGQDNGTSLPAESSDENNRKTEERSPPPEENGTSLPAESSDENNRKSAERSPPADPQEKKTGESKTKKHAGRDHRPSISIAAADGTVQLVPVRRHSLDPTMGIDPQQLASLTPSSKSRSSWNLKKARNKFGKSIKNLQKSTSIKNLQKSSIFGAERAIEANPDDGNWTFTENEMIRRRGIPVVHPEDPIRQCMNLFVVIALVYYTYALPFQLGFDVESSIALEAAIDIMFFGDIMLNFHTAYEEEISKLNQVTVLVMAKSKVRMKYLKSWFAIDFLSIIPFEHAFPSKMADDGTSYKFSRLLRCLKLFKLIRLVGAHRYLEQFTEPLNPSVLRLAKIPIYVATSAHVFACLFFYLGTYMADEDATCLANGEDGVNDCTWTQVAGLGTSAVSLSAQYTQSYYWAITTMTGVGYGDITPEQPAEMLFTIFAMLISSSMFAFFIGNISQLISSVDATKSLYKEKMVFVREFMQYQHLPGQLQSRIRMYYKHCWMSLSSSPFSEQNILAELSCSLRRDVVLTMHKDMVSKVPFFDGREPSFICEIIMRLKSEICAPHDIIIRSGSVGHEMFFLREGQVTVCSADFKTTYATLFDNSYFGEVGLLVTGRRTATVKATTHCRLMVLTKADFRTVCKDYPEIEKRIKELSQESGYTFQDEDAKDIEEKLSGGGGEKLKRSELEAQARYQLKRQEVERNTHDFEDDCKEEDQWKPFFGGSSGQAPVTPPHASTLAQNAVSLVRTMRRKSFDKLGSIKRSTVAASASAPRGPRRSSALSSPNPRNSAISPANRRNSTNT